jgi:DNA-binding NarL/FixJ family response regulator
MEREECILERKPIRTVPVGVVVVGANVLLREGLARILPAANFNIIASTSCADDHVLSTLPQEQSILLIIDMSDDFEAGLRRIESFKRRHAGARVAVLADQHQLAEMVSAFRAGANAYFIKVATCEIFIKSLELVMLGVTFVPPEIFTLVSARQPNSGDGRRAGDGHPDEIDDHDNGGEVVQIVGTDLGTNKPLSARQRSI